MKILITDVDDKTIGTSIDLRGADSGKLAHIMMQLERIKRKVQDAWEKLD